MTDHPTLKHINDLPPGLPLLCTEAAADGFRFLDRLVTEWDSGSNRFNAHGERLLGAFLDDRLVAIGGLNIDPYAAEAGTARLRHVYVLKAEQRRGLGRMLVRRLLEDAREARFSQVRLLTDTVAGARFYESLGFSSLRSPHGSHVMVLGRVSA
jgi:GNAT superfamily N-acetyltransferase